MSKPSKVLSVAKAINDAFWRALYCTPPPWDDLTMREKSSYVAMAKAAIREIERK